MTEIVRTPAKTAVAKPPTESGAPREVVAANTTATKRTAAKKSAQKKPPRPSAESQPAQVKKPAHRPSRRMEIVQSAIRVFSTTPYNQTTVEALAAECGVAPTAVYYHFGGKEELFDQAYVHCLKAMSGAVEDARAQLDQIDSNGLRVVIRAGWAWLRSHPVEGRMMMIHAGGATTFTRRTYADRMEWHANRAIDYLPDVQGAEADPVQARQRHAEAHFAAHFMNRMLNTSQVAWLDGPLSGQPMTGAQESLADVLVRIMAL